MSKGCCLGPAQVSAIMDLYGHDRVAAADLAEAYHVSVSVIYRVLRERGMTRRQGPEAVMSEREVQRARELWRRGALIYRLAAEYKVSRHTMSRYLRGVKKRRYG